LTAGKRTSTWHTSAPSHGYRLQNYSVLTIIAVNIKAECIGGGDDDDDYDDNDIKNKHSVHYHHKSNQYINYQYIQISTFLYFYSLLICSINLVGE